MKKVYRYILVFACILCTLSFTACKDNNQETNSDYSTDNGYCIVSLPQEYDISCDNDEVRFDANLYNAKTVNGNPKKEGFRYYKVLKNAPFRILTPLGMIQNQNENGQTLIYWKLNDKLYKDGDHYYSANIFTCNQDTEITPVYYEFRPVGILLYEVGENDMPTVPDEELFDDEGNIKEQTGLHYLYGVYDFEPYQNFWRTDLTLNQFVITINSKSVAENYYKDFYTLNIEIESGNLFEKGKIIVEKLCKIDGHGYMTYGALHVIRDDDTKKAIHGFEIGEHVIRYTFN